MPKALPCPLCEAAEIQVGQLGNRDAYLVTCDTCGRFIVSPEAWDVLRDPKYERERFRLSALTRRSGKNPIELMTFALDELLERSPAPSNPFDVLDRLLVHIQSKVPSLTGHAMLRPTDYPLFSMRSAQELKDFVNQLLALELVEGGEGTGATHVLRPSLKGWERVAELRHLGPQSNQAFVAMWFTPELESAWKGGFAAGVLDAGWSPVRVDQLQHNDKIDDKIVAEIRRSGLLVADFSGHRGGVYFEAGFALGLGIPVIWTVREQDLSAVHFDTRQYNHIVWTSPAELRERLRDRILATVPKPRSDAT